VVGLTRTPGKAETLAAAGVRPVVADALAPDAVSRVITEARPEVVIHQLTAIPDQVDLRHFDRDFALTDRLRSEGTRHLVTAARNAGAGPPLRVPVWLARLLVGAAGVAVMTQNRGISSVKAKRELSWTPAWPSWREGFRRGLG
jgi:hypothetical protein